MKKIWIVQNDWRKVFMFVIVVIGILYFALIWFNNGPFYDFKVFISPFTNWLVDFYTSIGMSNDNAKFFMSITVLTLIITVIILPKKLIRKINEPSKIKISDFIVEDRRQTTEYKIGRKLFSHSKKRYVATKGTFFRKGEREGIPYNYIYVTENGIFLIYSYFMGGKIKGNRDTSKWHQVCPDKVTQVSNPLPVIESFRQYVEQDIPKNIPVYAIACVSNNAKIRIGKRRKGKVCVCNIKNLKKVIHILSKKPVMTHNEAYHLYLIFEPDAGKIKTKGNNQKSKILFFKKRKKEVISNEFSHLLRQ